MLSWTNFVPKPVTHRAL